MKMTCRIYFNTGEFVANKQYDLDVDSPNDLFGQIKDLIIKNHDVNQVIQVKCSFQVKKSQIQNATIVPYQLFVDET